MTMLTLHAVFLAANGLLYMVIQIKYQNQRNSPFETQPVVMTISVVAFCVYLCATVLQAMLVETNNTLGDTKLLLYVIGCSGILSLLSNALLLLFTHKVGCIVLAIIAFAASIRLVCVLFMIISNYISERNNNNIINATSTSESLAMEVSSGINNNVNNAATTSESMENSIAVNNNYNNNNNSGTNNSNNMS